MLFKSKPKLSEFLPPPPPDEMEHTEDVTADVIAEETIAEPSSEEKKSSLAEEPTKEAITKKPISKKERGIKRPLKVQKPKAAKNTELEQLRNIIKKIDYKEKPQKKEIRKIKNAQKQIKSIKKPKTIDIEARNIEQDIDSELAKETETLAEQDMKFPDSLEDSGIGDFQSELIQKPEPIQEPEPQEVANAKEEIKSAIEKIKIKERHSLLKNLFARKEKQQKEAKRLVLEPKGIDDISIIQDKINEARQALMKLDLGYAKKKYLEIMQLYNKIRPEEQAKVYYDIKDIYSERKSAEKLKI